MDALVPRISDGLFTAAHCSEQMARFMRQDAPPPGLPQSPPPVSFKSLGARGLSSAADVFGLSLAVPPALARLSLPGPSRHPGAAAPRRV